jgi:filamentous hemagglutinin family protein
MMITQKPTPEFGSSTFRRVAPRMRRTVLNTVVLTAIWMLPSENLFANPTGGAVVGGRATITQAPGVTTIDQSSRRAVINWQGFSINEGELTQFNQPGKNAVALNRVTGNDPSNILGQLKANGNVWLVNRNGILIGPNAQVNVQGLIATTADISDQNFLAGHDDFSIPSPNPGASVVNEGTISIGEHGLGGLVAPHVRNSGVIAGHLSQVVIAGTPTFALDYYGDGLIQFAATSKVTENSDPSQPLVKNDGKISVDGGDILITADAAAAVVDEVINTDGIVEAHSVAQKGGAIVLNGGDEGLVHVAGTLDASAQEKGIAGGSVDVLGNKILVADGANVNASGPAGGGTVHVGGDLHGQGQLPTASETVVMPKAQITADATENGNGGQVVVWADDNASINGKISARGGSVSGNGGFVETSGKNHLELTSSPDASAPNGNAGTWLIDPTNITIWPGYPPILVLAAADTDFHSSVVYAGSISTALNNDTNVILDTSTIMPDAGELGNIIELPGASISKTGGTKVTLTLNADNNIILNGEITTYDAETGIWFPLNVILNADRDGNGAGAIAIVRNTALPVVSDAFIETNGDVILGGGADPMTMAAVGTTDQVDGILIDGGRIFSETGNISLTGKGYAGASSHGVHLTNGASIESGTGSNIAITGTPGGTDVYGIYVENLGGISNSGTTTFDSGIWDIDASSGAVNNLGKIVINSAHNVYLWDNDGIELGTSNVSGDLFVNADTASEAADGIVVSGPVTCRGDLELYAFGDISVQADVLANNVDIETFLGNFSNSSAVTATVDDVYVLADANIDINGSMAATSPAGTIHLDTWSGDIGQSAGTSLTADNFVIHAFGTAGNISLNGENHIKQLQIAGDSGVGSDVAASFGNVSFTNDESLLVSGISDTDTVRLTVNGDLELAGPIHTLSDGTSILINTRSFTNSVGSGALVAGGKGRYLVYSDDPANDSRNLPADEYSKRYNFPFNASDPEGAEAEMPLPTDGNFFLYAINPTLSIVAQNVSRVYGDPNPVLGYSYSGLIDGDSLTDALSGSPQLATSAEQTSNVGVYPINIDPATLDSPIGYTLELVDGELGVLPASLMITANDASRPYAAANPVFTAIFEGFRLQDNPSLVSGLQFDTNARLLSPPGRYTIAPYGASAENYSIEYRNGTLKVNPGPVQKLGESGGLSEILPDMPLKPDVHLQPGAPHLLTPSQQAVYSVPAIVQTHEPGDLLFSNDGNRELWGL